MERSDSEMMDHLGDTNDDVRAAVASLKDGEPAPSGYGVPLEYDPNEADGRRGSDWSPDPATADRETGAGQPTTRARSPDGRFAKEIDRRRAESMSALERAEWSKMPPSLQKAWYAMESNVQAGVNQLKSKHAEQIGQFENSFAPLRSAYQAYGFKSDADALRALSVAHQALVNDPVNAIAHLIRQAGPEVQRQLMAMAGQVPQQYAPQHQPVDVRAQIREEIGLAQAANEIDQFAQSGKAPHFEQVRPVMSQLLQSGAASTLQDAYNAACYAAGLPVAQPQHSTTGTRFSTFVLQQSGVYQISLSGSGWGVDSSSIGLVVGTLNGAQQTNISWIVEPTDGVLAAADHLIQVGPNTVLGFVFEFASGGDCELIIARLQ